MAPHIHSSWQMCHVRYVIVSWHLIYIARDKFVMSHMWLYHGTSYTYFVTNVSCQICDCIMAPHIHISWQICDLIYIVRNKCVMSDMWLYNGTSYAYFVTNVWPHIQGSWQMCHVRYEIVSWHLIYIVRDKYVTSYKWFVTNLSCQLCIWHPIYIVRDKCVISDMWWYHVTHLMSLTLYDRQELSIFMIENSCLTSFLGVYMIDISCRPKW